MHGKHVCREVEKAHTMKSAHLPAWMLPVTSPMPAISALRFVAVYRAKELGTPQHLWKYCSSRHMS